jgi:Replication-relaxation
VTATEPSCGLPGRAIEIVASVALHRALSTEQVRLIHMPGVRKRWGQRVMARLGKAGLLAFAQTNGAPQRLWFATQAGVRAAREAGTLQCEPRLFTAAEVAGPLQAHTVAVNDAAICFLKTARERGDEFGAFSWRQEVAHPLSLGRGRRRRTLFADAVITYLRLTQDEIFVEQRFLELDRATMAVDSLAAQLGRYAQLYRLKGKGNLPLWRSRYPSFPPVLCVLTGASRHLLERRRDTTLALLRSNPEVSRTPEVSIRVCLAEDLAEQGPFAPIFYELHRPEKSVDWLGSWE